MSSMQDRFPEAMALADLANRTAERARTAWIGFLSFAIFLALATFGTTHRDLFLGTPLALPPPISIKLDLFGFYVVAPLLLLALHIYILVKHALLAQIHFNFEAQLSRDVHLLSERKQARKHLSTTIFLHTLSAWRIEGETSLSTLALLAFLLISGLAVAPLAVLVFTWARFLPYQSEVVTMIHRSVVAVDVAAIILSFRAVTGWRFSAWVRWLVYSVAAFSVAFTWIFLTFPRECWDYDEIYCWDNNPLSRIVGKVRTLGYILKDPDGLAEVIRGIETTAPIWPPTSLDLVEEDFTEDTKLVALQARHYTYNFQFRSLIGANFAAADLRKATFYAADVRAANFRDADLRSTTLSFARMEGTNFTEAKMQGAVIVQAQLNGADLSYSAMQGANLAATWMQGADLIKAEMQGTDLRWAHLEGANIFGAKLHGANLAKAELTAADLMRAELVGANLSEAKLQSANLSNALMTAANLAGAEMQGTNFTETELQGANFLNAKTDGAIFRKALLWRVGSLPPEGNLVVTDPIFRQIENKEGTIDAWLRSIPSGDLHVAAQGRFEVLLRGPVDEDEIVTKSWNSRAQKFSNELARNTAFDLHLASYYDEISRFLCNWRWDQLAVDGILEGVFRRAWREKDRYEQFMSIRESLKRCPPVK